MIPVKLVLTNKKNLVYKYGKNAPGIFRLLNDLKKADKAKHLETKIVFVDDTASCKSAGVKKISINTDKEYKRIVDDLYRKHVPVYITLVGAQDVFPFQEIDNPAEDEDVTVPSDLPYACDAPYSRSINAYTGPSRVVGRIPDIIGKQADFNYLKTVIGHSISQKPQACENYMEYFAVTAQVWKRSTAMSLQRIFSDNNKLFLSPKLKESTAARYTKAQLKPKIHFINCHGAKTDPAYYGQRGQNNFPEALKSSIVDKNITHGTVIAAECCYGAELYDPTNLQPSSLGIANTYLKNGAIAFLGSSTIAYGPSDSNALADLITQYFIKNILKGSSAGRALLEARQQYLSDTGPQLDPYELKTLAQFYLLGDPSNQPVIWAEEKQNKTTSGGTIENNRVNLYHKGVSLKNSIAPSSKQRIVPKPSDAKRLKEIIQATHFEDAEKELMYVVKPKLKGLTGMQKKLAGQDSRFRTFIKGDGNAILHQIKVLVVKEDKEQILGYRVYESR